jgi:Ca-activated chloride channel family protein
MRVFIVFLLLNIYLNASLLDFYHIKKAKDAYVKKDYKSAFENYNKIDNQQALYNKANSLYKMKKYKEAIKLYQNIDDKKLQFNKLFNLGNSYANIKDIDKAIKSYEDALKLKDDKDLKSNLKLLKKIKRQKKNKNKKQEKKKDKNGKQEKSKQKQQPPISNMEERKWQKMLNSKKINTLMLPIRKGEKNDKTNLW